MKYVRKVTALVLAIIFCAAIVIGIGVIFSVKNVNVEFVDYSGEYTEEYERTKENLNKLKGSGLLFLSEADVKSKLSGGDVITIESYERIYPCTVNVKVKERVECFTVRTADGVSVYDEDGVFMRSVRTENGDYLNPLDNSPDITVGAADSKLSDDDYKCVASLCRGVKSSFGALRKIVESVTVYGSLNTANIKLRSGISIAVSDWKNNAENKIEAVFEEYKNLSDKQRTCGMITVADGERGTRPTAKYR